MHSDTQKTQRVEVLSCSKTCPPVLLPVAVAMPMAGTPEDVAYDLFGRRKHGRVREKTLIQRSKAPV